MIEVLSVILLGLHLAMVDVAMAGPLLCVWLEWRQTRRQDELAGQLGRSLAGLSAWALLGGMITGAAVVGIYWRQADHPFFAAVERVPASRLWFALVEALFSLACMVTYAALWRRWTRRRWAHAALAIAASTNLMIHFPALFAILAVVASRGDSLASVLDRSAYQRMLVDPEIVARVLHVWLAAASVTAAVVMGLACRQAASTAALITRHAAQIALLATALQIPVGMWLAMQLPESARAPMFGADPLATTFLLASIGLALWLLQILSSIAQGDCSLRVVWRSIAVMLAIVMMMTAVLARAKVSARGQPSEVGRISAHQTSPAND